MIKTAPLENPVEKAIAVYGSEAKLGEACGLSQAAINKAKRQFAKEGKVSPRMAVAIDKATKGTIPKRVLCPQYFGAAA